MLHTCSVVIAPDAPIVTISPPGPIQGALVGSPQTIDCIATTSIVVYSGLLNFIWMGPHGDSITTNSSRVTIDSITSSGNTYTSRLQFAYLTERDGGNYTCNVQLFNVSGSNSIVIEQPDCEYML